MSGCFFLKHGVYMTLQPEGSGDKRINADYCWLESLFWDLLLVIINSGVDLKGLSAGNMDITHS